MRRPLGFTLLELLVVLAIVAALAGVATPIAGRWLDAAEMRGWRADLRAQLEHYPVQAFLSGEDQQVDLERLQRDLKHWPTGAQLRLAKPLKYSAAGAAEAGELMLELGAWQSRWRIEAVTGRVIEVQP